MQRCYRVFVAYGLMLLLGACASTSALEPQNQPLAARQARLHFIRQPTILSGLGSAEIKVDGKPVGSLASGSYIVADRLAGAHTISVVGDFGSGFDAEIRIEAGASYFYELGPFVERNIDLFKLDSMGVTGRPVSGRHGFNAPFMFYTLDENAGVASIARLRPKNS